MGVEPDTSLLMRIAIINYEVGDLTKNIAYAERFPNDKNIYLALAKGDIADALVQIELLCKRLDTNISQALEDGREHMRVRYDEFAKNSWKAA